MTQGSNDRKNGRIKASGQHESWHTLSNDDEKTGEKNNKSRLKNEWREKNARFVAAANSQWMCWARSELPEDEGEGEFGRRTDKCIHNIVCHLSMCRELMANAQNKWETAHTCNITTEIVTFSQRQPGWREASRRQSLLKNANDEGQKSTHRDRCRENKMYVKAWE